MRTLSGRPGPAPPAVLAGRKDDCACLWVGRGDLEVLADTAFSGGGRIKSLEENAEENKKMGFYNRFS